MDGTTAGSRVKRVLGCVGRRLKDLKSSKMKMRWWETGERNRECFLMLTPEIVVLNSLMCVCLVSSTGLKVEIQ